MAMLPAPSPQLVARAAARYAAAQFPALSSWLSYENELADEWLAQSAFVCAVEYATNRVMEMIRTNRAMSTIAAEYGGGAKGVAEVVGRIVGEWAAGGTTIDAELATW